MFIQRHPSILQNEAAGGEPTGAGSPPPAPAAPAAPTAPPPAAAAQQPAPAQPAPAASASAAAPERDPEWITKRVAQAKTSAERDLLKQLGVSSLDDAKAAIADRQAKIEAEKTVAQKAAEYEAELKNVRASNESLVASISTYAKAQLDTLTDPQRDAVVAIAGEDPSKQLTTIEKLRPTWAVAPAAALPATPAAPPPANTAPGRNAPRDSGNAAPADPKAIYEELKKSNPVVAARYALANGVHDAQ